MTNHQHPAWFHGTVGLGGALIATIAVVLLLPWTFNAYLALAVWLVCVNLVTFVYYGYDKYQAKRAGRRVPEVVLHVLAVAGGSLGAFAAMAAFRHKTVKGSFRIVFWFIVVVQVAACAVVAYGLWQRAPG
jgi:uncharacterized membrane protein YsdA (DUF1294 family)